MSKEHGGDQSARAAELAAFDPIYVMPEAVKGDLENLFEALEVVGLLASAANPQDDQIMGLADMAPLNRSLSALGKRLLGDITAQFPTARGAAQA